MVACLHLNCKKLKQRCVREGIWKDYKKESVGVLLIRQCFQTSELNTNLALTLKQNTVPYN